MLRCRVQAFVVCVISGPQCYQRQSTRFAGRFGAASCRKTPCQRTRPARKTGRAVKGRQGTPRDAKKRRTSGKERESHGSAHEWAKAAKEVRALATSDIFDLRSRGRRRGCTRAARLGCPQALQLGGG